MDTARNTGGCKTLVDHKDTLHLNKELMKWTVHLQVVCASAKLNFIKVALIFEVNWNNGEKLQTAIQNPIPCVALDKWFPLANQFK